MTKLNNETRELTDRELENVSGGSASEALSSVKAAVVSVVKDVVNILSTGTIANPTHQQTNGCAAG